MQVYSRRERLGPTCNDLALFFSLYSQKRCLGVENENDASMIQALTTGKQVFFYQV